MLPQLNSIRKYAGVMARVIIALVFLLPGIGPSRPARAAAGVTAH